MDITKFLQNYHSLICSDSGEGEFAAIRTLCPGLSSPKLGKVLNYAGRLLPEDEIYLEIGTFCGYTLISAGHHNTQTKFLGIDNFRLLGEKTTPEHQAWVKSRLKLNMEHFKYGNHHFIESDYRKVELGPEVKIGVFYIDGHHTREEVVENFKWAHDRLADQALIFVDDISIAHVGEGIKDWVKDRHEYYEFFHMDSFYPEDNQDHWNNSFWNGLSILTFKREKQK